MDTLTGILVALAVALERLEISGRETPLVGRCRITSLAVGRMEVQSLDMPPVAMSFTGREFEALHPVVARERR